MKNSKLIASLSIILISVSLSSCSIIGGIFKTGMGVGIFIVVVILVVIGAIFMRSGKK